MTFQFQMVFGNCGVLQEMAAEKGFVEMTGIDAETSQDIAEVSARRKSLYSTFLINDNLVSVLIGHHS